MNSLKNCALDIELIQKLNILELPVLGCYGNDRVEFTGQTLTPKQASLYRAVLQNHTYKGPLNKDQHDVLKLIADGKTNKEISLILKTPVEMVAYHIRALRYRLNAIDRAHAVAIAFRLGILE
jgi:DNA-binding CsgD family transcriptional regulator